MGTRADDVVRFIRNFELEATSSIFVNISRDRFIEDLNRHIKNPEKIQQGKNGTCGAAVLSKYIAETHPLLYVETAITLYRYGEFSRNGVTVRVPKNAFSGSSSILQKININSVDAIMQGAFTNSQNLLLGYNSFNDGSGLRSFMHPLALNRYIGKFIGAKFNRIFSPTAKNVESLDYENHFVIGIIHSSSDNSIKFGFPNHYIQVLSAKDNVVEYWSWGEINHCEIVDDSRFNGFYSIISIEK